MSAIYSCCAVHESTHPPGEASDQRKIRITISQNDDALEKIVE